MTSQELVIDDPQDTTPVMAAWLCSWDDQRRVVWAWTIDEARLEARKEAGPHVAVKARLATHAEQAEAEKGAA